MARAGSSHLALHDREGARTRAGSHYPREADANFRAGYSLPRLAVVVQYALAADECAGLCTALWQSAAARRAETGRRHGRRSTGACGRYGRATAASFGRRSRGRRGPSAGGQRGCSVDRDPAQLHDDDAEIIRGAQHLPALKRSFEHGPAGCGRAASSGNDVSDLHEVCASSGHLILW